MTVSLIAMVGPLGEIGHSDGSRPEFEGVQGGFDWFTQIVGDGVVVCGRRTVDQMVAEGVRVDRLPYILSVYTREFGAKTPEKFVSVLHHAFPRKDIFIAGGCETYRAFMHLCEAFYIRRSEVRGEPDLLLPPLFMPKGIIH